MWLLAVKFLNLFSNKSDIDRIIYANIVMRLSSGSM